MKMFTEQDNLAKVAKQNREMIENLQAKLSKLGLNKPKSERSQPLCKALTSPKEFRIPTFLSLYSFFSSGLLILEDQTELAQSSPR